MSLTLRRCRALLVIALALAACSDSAGPEAAAGTYRLVEYEGRSLPTVTRRIIESPVIPGSGSGAACDDILEAMTLALDESERFSQTTDRRLACGDPMDRVARTTDQGSYSVSGSTVRLVFDAPAGTSLVAEGRLASGTLTIARLTGTSDGITVVTNTRQVFRRVQ